MITSITYLGAAGLGFALVLVGLMLGFAGGDVDTGHAGAEADGADVSTGHSDSSVGSGLSLLSLTGIGSVLAGFGLFGYVVPSLGGAPWLGVPVGLVGAAIFFRLTGLVRGTLVRTLETGSSAGERDLIYQPAVVTIPIPAGGKGRGQVKVRKGDKTFYVSARSELDRELNTGEQVVILAAGDGVYTVDLLQV